MTDEQDMHKMGGLFRKVPITAITMGIATLAINGIPPFSGFWSKDEILASVYARGGWFSVLWVIGLVTALMTAFYMTRQWVLVFLGEPRWDEGKHPHESPRVMTTPLIALAGLAVIAGIINTPFGTKLETFLEPSFEGISMQHPPDDAFLLVVLSGLAVLAAVGGIAAAYLTYRRPKERWLDFEHGLQPVWGMWESAYRIDDLYGATLVAPGKKMADVTAFDFDVEVIDGAVNGVGRVVRNAGAWARTLQTGYVRNYGVLFLGGALVIVIWLTVGGS